MPPVPGLRRSGARLDHLIEEQLLWIDVAPHLAGPALLDRVGEINRRRFLPAIAQVLGEFDVPGESVSIGTLHLALGHFLPGDLDRAETVLRTRLREALAAVLRKTSETVRQREGEALVGAFEHYLLHGVWPSGRAIALATAPAEMLERLIEEDPLALVAMLRRRGPGGALLRRLVRQMPHALLARLLHRLEPVHAAYVLAYLDEVRGSHAAERLIAASPAALAELLWTIVLRDALQEAGLQANRKAFLRRLLRQLARNSGTALPALIAQLRRGLPRTVARRRAPGSLVAILEELIADEPDLIADGCALPELAALLGLARRLTARERDAAARLAAAVAPAQLRWLLHRLAAADPSALATAIERVLPFERALVILWDIDPGLPAALERLALSPGERAALLGLAARAADRPETPDRLAAALIAEMRGVRTDQIRLPQARRRQRPAIRREDPMASLTTALAAAADDPSPAEIAHLREVLAEAMQVDCYAARQLLRRFVAADPRRLSRLFGEEPFAEAAARLLPPHLGACFAALDRAASCTAAERRTLLTVVAPATQDVDLPEALLARALAALARSRRTTAATLRARLASAAIAGSADRDATLALLRTPVAEAVRRTASRHDALERFALLWRESAGLAPSKRAAALVRLLPRLTGITPESLRARLPATPAWGLRGVAPHHLLAAFPMFALRRLALLLSIPKADLRDAPPDKVLAIVAGRILEETPPMALAQIAATTGGTGASDRRGKGGHLRIAARLRARPFDALRLLANAAEVPNQMAPLLQDPLTAPLLFASMAPGERTRISRLLGLLTGRRGRLAIAPAKVAKALALAASAQAWQGGGGRGFAAEWLRQLTGQASLSEQAALRRLLGELPPGEASGAIGFRETAPSSSPGIVGIARALLGMQPNASTNAVLRALAAPRARVRVARELGENALVRLLAALAPAAAGGLLHAAERLAAARRAAGAPIDRAAQWQCVLAAAGSAQPIPRLVSEFLDGAEDTSPLPAPVRKRTEALLAGALEGMRDAPLKVALGLRARERSARAAEAGEMTAEMTTTHIRNAGLVIAAPFLPRLFESLGYLAPVAGGLRWAEETCPSRAVHLLQWLVDEQVDAPEPQLALNKILCGLDPATPVAASVALTEQELDTGQNLLAAILARWPPLAESSSEALRQTFFQREGRLIPGEHGWSLEVETRVLDVLLHQLPWSFSTILHPWMRKPLTVGWR